LSLFSRRARWLNQIFPASVTPTIKDPGSRSDDVSLVQPYDGSGWGIPESGAWIQRSVQLRTTVLFHIFFQLNDNEVYRLLAADLAYIAGPGNTDVRVLLSSIDKNGTGDQIILANEIVQNYTPGGIRVLVHSSPIIGPGCSLRVDLVLSTDVTERITVGVMGVRAPIGTVFYV